MRSAIRRDLILPHREHLAQPRTPCFSRDRGAHTCDMIWRCCAKNSRRIAAISSFSRRSCTCARGDPYNHKDDVLTEVSADKLGKIITQVTESSGRLSAGQHISLAIDATVGRNAVR